MQPRGEAASTPSQDGGSEGERSGGSSRSATSAGERESYKGMEFPFTSGVYEDPEAKTHKKGFWYIVDDLHAVIQQTAAKHAAASNIACPPNVPADQYWVQLLIDKGGGSTKVVLKHICINKADSVYNMTVVGLLTAVKDTREAISAVFQPLFDQFNELNRGGKAIMLGWQPSLPEGVMLHGGVAIQKC